jgi:MYXO-CTERM domain-containing protein
VERFPVNGYTEYTVTGTLQSGDALDATYDDYGGTLEFNGVPASPVPEASTVSSLGLLLVLGLGGVAVARRRRAAVGGSGA